MTEKFNLNLVYIDSGPVMCAWCKARVDRAHHLLSEHGQELVVCDKCFRAGIRQRKIVRRSPAHDDT